MQLDNTWLMRSCRLKNVVLYVTVFLGMVQEGEQI
jgi:hypothetical protein